MTKLEGPLRRLIEIAGGEEIVLEIFPADEGIGAHLKLRRPGARKSYFTMYLQPPAAAPAQNLAPRGRPLDPFEAL